MKSILPLALVAAFACSTAAIAADAPASRALQLLDLLQAGDMQGVEALFTPELAQRVPADKLGTAWASLAQAAGAQRGRGEPQAMQVAGGTVVVVPLHFERGEFQARVVVDAQQRVSSLLLQPATIAPAAPVPADAAFSERDFTVPGPRFALPGTLTMPQGKGPFPAVVLVHGSGSTDRNASIGANHPFLDVARGLASRGIAVLRYDKRSYALPNEFAPGRDYTVDDETTDDAVAAIAALRATPGIDPGRVFVMGHSQGAMLAPRIAARSGQVAGAVMWAAPARTTLALLLEQSHYLLALDGELSAQDQASLRDLQQKIGNVHSGRPDVAPADTPFGQTVGYWRSLEQVDPLADLRRGAQPTLLLQGGRDYQVTDTDWQLWQAALKSDPHATLKRYPALNHLGIAGTGPGRPDEYFTPGHVDATLIADTADWLLAQPSRSR